jgi:hypothetical protein
LRHARLGSKASPGKPLMPRLSSHNAISQRFPTANLRTERQPTRNRRPSR